MAGLAAVLLAGACRQLETVSYPAEPPYGFEWPNVRQRFVSTARLRAYTGADAEDCGLARDQASADRVYECASRALAAARPFFCRYEDAAQPVMPPVSVVPIGRHPDLPCAYAGTRERTIVAMWVQPDGSIETRPVLGPGSDPLTRRMRAGWIPPRLLRAEPVDTGNEEVSRTVFVEATIDAHGVVSRARLLTPDPEIVEKRARDAVEGASFEPARFFGVPQPFACVVMVHVDRGVITVSGVARAA